ncbi:glycosyltransferase, partial [Vibrio harveyi]|uniref:glycosyltransferase n=1 Tax=Vibrio harveyi TaxID=669 RepID=UPI000682233C
SSESFYNDLLYYAKKHPIIKLYRNEENKGHVATFEAAISLASGSIIVLSDQDDIWFDNKIPVIKTNLVKNEFYHHSKVLFDTNGRSYDENSLTFDCSYNDLNQVDKLLRLFYNNHYFGCCMAFKASLKNTILPFPKNTYAHDHWIALNAIINGKLYSDNEKLIYYRQHENNVTPKSGLSFSKKILTRIKLLKLLIIATKRSFNV